MWFKKNWELTEKAFPCKGEIEIECCNEYHTMNVVGANIVFKRCRSISRLPLDNFPNNLGRHHTYNTVDGQVELQEVGPRFELKLYDIKLGSIDEAAALDSEWSLKPFMNTSRKRLFLGEPSELADGV